jgi:hypothetical protein
MRRRPLDSSIVTRYQTDLTDAECQDQGVAVLDTETFYVDFGALSVAALADGATALV